MPISGLIVRTKQDLTDSVAGRLKNLREATVSEVHDNNIVVVTETDKQSRDKDIWKEIESIPGVVQCDLIYHNFEDEEDFQNE